MRALTLSLILLAAGCTPGVYAEKPPAEAPFQTVVEIDGHQRIVSVGLMRLAARRAELNATANNPLIHTNLDEHVAVFGVMAENVGTAEDWQAMYKTWRNSYQHAHNIQSNLKYVGYSMFVAPSSGMPCFVVVYSSRAEWPNQ